MSKQVISPSAQSVVKLKETGKGWVVTYKDIVLHAPLPREEAANARMRIIRAMNLHSQECEAIGEERGKTEGREAGKQEERGRIAEGLKPLIVEAEANDKECPYGDCDLGGTQTLQNVIKIVNQE